METEVKLLNELGKKIYPTPPDADGFFYENALDEAAGDKKRSYPTKTDDEGWFVEDETDDAMGIFTVNAGGAVNKKVVLSTGQVAIISELTGDDMMVATRMAGKSKDQANKVTIAILCLATKVDGKIIPMEDFGKLKMKDFSKLMAANGGINF